MRQQSPTAAGKLAASEHWALLVRENDTDYMFGHINNLAASAPKSVAFCIRSRLGFQILSEILEDQLRDQVGW